MRLLTKLSPAETLLLRHGEKTLLRELLKYTFLDLLLKQVLSIVEVTRQPSTHDPARVYKYVTAGKRFKTYESKPHEVVFTSIFQSFPEYQVLFRNLVKMAYQNAKSQRKYALRLSKGPNLNEAFNTSWISAISGRLNYTTQGIILRDEVTSELADVEALIPHNTQNKPHAIETFKAIGGNIFLIKGLDFNLVRELDQEVVIEDKQRSGPLADPVWMDVILLDTMSGHTSSDWDDHSDSNDHGDSSDSGGIDSDGGSGDSGCSGCSSGCSGCGGD